MNNHNFIWISIRIRIPIRIPIWVYFSLFLGWVLGLMKILTLNSSLFASLVPISFILLCLWIIIIRLCSKDLVSEFRLCFGFCGLLMLVLYLDFRVFRYHHPKLSWIPDYTPSTSIFYWLPVNSHSWNHHHLHLNLLFSLLFYSFS